MRKSVFYSLKTFTQGRVPSADASTGSISYKVDGLGTVTRADLAAPLLCMLWLCYLFLEEGTRK